MELVCSPWGIVSWEFPNQGLNDIRRSFDSIALDIGGIAGYHAYRIEGWRKKKDDRSYRHWITENPEKVGEILMPFLSVIKGKNFKIPVAYANFLPPRLGKKEDNDDLFESIRKLAEECVNAAGKAGCRYIIMRPPAVGMGDRNIWEANKEYYLSLTTAAKKYGATILLESQYRLNNGGVIRGLCANPYEASKWVDDLNEAAGFECFGFHLDIGTYSFLGQNMRDAAVILGDRIKAITLRDCDGMGDTAILPFTFGVRTDWLNIIRGLREISFDGPIIMNFATTASVTSPMLKPALIKYAREIGDFFAWQADMENMLKRYDKRVLFGAGNMCRAYMKCYGEKYPPLFTCDNDKVKWGTEFCGLKVKSPEKLKNLPKDCAVLICNVYYREIESQLRDMGIENPIVFFNDEYMPSFHFERIEDMEEENELRDWGTDAERP
ncbi:MAG: sugar phosphate isomerase/epimerase [Selenomonadaceae bacterium]|nr:sugar phosphate isomerase/epimerase [Selenomonadaceae bacterium]